MNRTRGKLVTRLLKDVVFFLFVLKPDLKLQKKKIYERKKQEYTHILTYLIIGSHYSDEKS